MKEYIDRLVGVIDLKRGRCVHAVAGQRERYRPVTVASGDPLRLADLYWQLGVRHLYVADLDAICGGRIDVDLAEKLFSRHPWMQFLFDGGWLLHQAQSTIDAICKIANKSSLRLIVPTEANMSASDLGKITELVASDRILVGLDFFQGIMRSNSSSESDWIQAIQKTPIGGAVILDTSTVGTGNADSSIKLCERLVSDMPRQTIYSGGGVQDGKDMQRFFDAGCNYVLAATALLRSFD